MFHKRQTRQTNLGGKKMEEINKVKRKEISTRNAVLLAILCCVVIAAIGYIFAYYFHLS